jgi:hypothetical protein
MDSQDKRDEELELISLIRPHWYALFFVSGAVILIVVGLSIGITTGLSAADDRVFAVEALISGLLAEFLVFRRLLKKRLVLILKWPVPFVYFWPLLCLYVFVARPFE